MIQLVGQVAPLLAPLGGGVVATPLSIHYALQLGVQATIVGIVGQGSLPGVAADSVLVRKVPYAGDVGNTRLFALPAVLIFPGPTETIEPTAGTNQRDDYGYPVVLAVVAADDSPSANHNQYLAWREVMIRQFQHRRFTIDAPAVTFYDCVVEPGPIVDWSRWAGDNRFVTVFTLRFFTRLVRGNS